MAVFDQAGAEIRCGRGWQLLERGDPEGAVDEFRESLQLAPEFEPARRGVLAAIEVRQPLLRLLVRYQRWIARLDRTLYWPFLLLIFLASQTLALIATRIPRNNGWASIVLLLLLCFALFTWIGEPALNAFLRIHKWGRLSLTRDQARASNVLMVLGASTLFFIGAGRVQRQGIFFVIAGFCALLALPASQAYSNPPGPGSRKLVRYVEVMALLAAVSITGFALRSVLGNIAGALFVVAFFAFTFYAERVLPKP
jgi:hypothetical protein